MTTVTDSITLQASKEHPLPEFATGHAIAGYEVIKKLDEGLMGAVYKVKHAKTGKTLALKILRPSLLHPGMTIDRFNHEIQLIGQVKHPGLVEVFDSGEHDGTFFFTMEYVDGATSLRRVLTEYQASGKDMPRKEMLDILTGLLKILDELHPANLHRNIKPENILILETKSADGKVSRRIRLTDMSIVKVVSLAESSLDREGAWYLAPEMSEFKDKATASSDLYSVGAIFYEMLTGSPPLGRYELPSALLEGGVSELVDDLVEISLAPNPQDRFHTADDMLAALEETFSDYYGAGQVKLGRTLLLLGILALVAAAAAVYFKESAPTEEELRAAQMDHRAAVLADVSARSSGGAAPATSDAKYEDMVWIPAGPYVAGKWSAYDDAGLAGERAESVVEVPGFWIDKYEGHLPPRSVEADPDADPAAVEAAAAEAQAWNDENAWTVDIDRTYAESKGLCEQAGKRLCSEDEWEKACKGPENWSYTYGNTFEKARCPASGYSRSQPYRANEHLACASGYGVMNMGGGVTEWTATGYGDGSFIVKPGPVGSDAQSTRCAGRTDRADTFAQIHVGYRCCAD